MPKKIIAIVIIILSAIMTIGIAHHNANQKTGSDWLEEQSEYISELQVWSDDLDKVTSLYINGNIDQENYLAHIDLLEKELALLEADYSVGKESVKIGSYSEIEKAGCDSVEECFSVMNDMISMIKEYSDNKYELSYNYIAFQQSLIYAIQGYTDVMSGSEQGEFSGE